MGNLTGMNGRKRFAGTVEEGTVEDVECSGPPRKCFAENVQCSPLRTVMVALNVVEFLTRQVDVVNET
ncbi:hypothetical protein TNCV_5140471 [Trichonephila clavipes]|nr:hypothetical protein TNCV_5140471 [Trichonephila clavipes]